jgi:hypothetical protein
MMADYCDVCFGPMTRVRFYRNEPYGGGREGRLSKCTKCIAVRDIEVIVLAWKRAVQHLIHMEERRKARRAGTMTPEPERAPHPPLSITEGGGAGNQ